MGIIKDEITEIKRRYADERRTEISALDGEIDMLDLIEEEDMVVTITHNGYIKRLASSTYRAQRRGGKGIIAAQARDEDFVEQLYVTSTHDAIMFFTDRGRAFKKFCYEIPEAGRTSRGTAVINLLNLEPGEKVTAILPVPEENQDDYYLIMATKKGIIKRVELSAFANMRKTGLIAISLRENDSLIAVRLTQGDSQLMLGSRNGLSIRFEESELRAIGRNGMGVRSMDLGEDDEVVDISVVDETKTVLAITENGYGKRTSLDEFRVQSRAGKGIKAMQITEKTGKLAAQLLVSEDEDLMLITVDGTIIRIPVSSVSMQGRSTQGVRLMRVGDSRISRVAPAAKEDVTEEESAGQSTDGPQEIREEDAGMSGSGPDALDRLLEDLEENPEPKGEDDI